MMAHEHRFWLKADLPLGTMPSNELYGGMYSNCLDGDAPDDATECAIEQRIDAIAEEANTIASC